MIPEKPLEPLAPCLVGHDGKPVVRKGLADSRALERYLSEEELLDEEEEADVSLLPENVSQQPSVHADLGIRSGKSCLPQELVDMIESLRDQLAAERKRNLVQEIAIRKEMGDAMLQQLMEGEERRRSFFSTSGFTCVVSPKHRGSLWSPNV